MDKRERETLPRTVESWNRYIREREISDFQIRKLEREALTLVGSFDLSYYHDIEITITGVSYLNVSTCFYVDLSELSPFSICFLPEEAVLRFWDCGMRQQGEIRFEGNILLCMEHISYG